MVIGFRHHFRSGRIDWRKLLLAACVLTTATAIIQTRRTPYPLTKCYLFPSVIISSFEAFNSTILVNESMPPLAELERFPPISIAPFGLINSSPSNVSILDTEQTSGVSQDEKLPHEREENAVLEWSPNISIAPTSMVNFTVINVSIPKVEETSRVSQWENPAHVGEENLKGENFNNPNVVVQPSATVSPPWNATHTSRTSRQEV